MLNITHIPLGHVQICRFRTHAQSLTLEHFHGTSMLIWCSAAPCCQDEEKELDRHPRDYRWVQWKEKVWEIRNGDQQPWTPWMDSFRHWWRIWFYNTVQCLQEAPTNTYFCMFSFSLFVFSDSIERFIQFVLHKGRSFSEFRSLKLHCLSVNVFFGSLD